MAVRLFLDELGQIAIRECKEETGVKEPFEAPFSASSLEAGSLCQTILSCGRFCPQNTTGAVSAGGSRHSCVAGGAQRYLALSYMWTHREQKTFGQS